MEASENTPPLSQDAALVLALAGIAVPFSSSPRDEAEHWLRILRVHGQVGATLQALGVGELPLVNGSDPRAERVTGPQPLGDEVVSVVSDRATSYALEHEAPSVGTVHVLFAVLEVYDRLFDRALYVRGTSREELLDLLASRQSASRPRV
jgi:hypothetical protein